MALTARLDVVSAMSSTRSPARSRRRPAGLEVVFAIAPAAPLLPDPVASARLTASARDRVWGLLLDTDELEVLPDGVLRVLLGRAPGVASRRRVASMTANLARRPLDDLDGPVFVDVGVSWSRSPGRDLGELIDHARGLLSDRDLQARRWRRATVRKRLHVRPPGLILQFAIVLAATFVLPLGAMIAGHFAGIPVAGTLFTAVVAVMVTSALLQWTETILGLVSRPNPPPARGPRPPASAIIAAYLPNEAATIVETLQSFLGHDYAGGLQVILAYNSPQRLPIEDELEALARDDRRLVLVRVPGSTSKAQNVNAALGVVTGEFVGIFDADHQPDPGSFRRASRWLENGADVVQGHCVVRNGDDSGVARTVAVEFEQIYAVSHRGRQLFHGFGVFGGSNGYWRTELIRTVRMMPAMLTEDIDCSIRATREGARIINDPGLVSRELAPDTVRALWRQRMRWAQGWAQVTAVHARAVLIGDELSPHQRVGMMFHLVWREAFPVISALMWPLLAFYLWRDGAIGFSNQILVLISAFTLGTLPVQVLLVRTVADEEIARRGDWWAWYLPVTVLAYQEFKNTIARVALVKLAMGERNWVVTPRATSPSPGAAAPSGAAPSATASAGAIPDLAR